jgi:hypothetical protein
MPNGTVCRMRFDNAEQQPVLVNLYDRLSDASAPKPYGLSVTWTVPSPTNTFVQIVMTNPPAGLHKVRYDYYFPDGTFFVFFEVNATTATRNASLSYALTGWKLIITLYITDKPNEEINMTTTDPVVIDLQPAGSPVVLSVVDNDEDKASVIRAKQAVLTFLSESSLTLDAFATNQAYDDRYYVTIDVAGLRCFEGHLLLDDLTEPFLDPSNEVTLTASDKVASLKDVALTKDDGNNPRGKYRLIDYITWSLKKTGLRLPVNVVMNIRNYSWVEYLGAIFLKSTSLTPNILRIPKLNNYISTYISGTVIKIDAGATMYSGSYLITSVNELSTYWEFFLGTSSWTVDSVQAKITVNAPSQNHFYNESYLDSRTFEKAINESEDCYNVLQKILGESCMLTQERGAWWIVNIDEREGGNYLVASFDADGTFIDFKPLTAYHQQVGRDLAVWHAELGSDVELSRPIKYLQENYKYTWAKELVCNIDYQRGVRKPVRDIDTMQLAYVFECWAMKEGTPGGLVPSTEDFFIRRVFENSYEKQRFIVIAPTAAPKYLALLSEPMSVYVGDIVNPSVDVRFNGSVHPNSGLHRTNVMQIILNGYDGTVWTLHGGSSVDQEARWVQSNAAMTTPLYYFVIEGTGNNDDTNWVATTGITKEDYPPVPVSGEIVIGLLKTISNNAREQQFSNLNLDYKPLVNGSYRKYNGHYYKVNNTGNLLAKRDKQFYLETTDRMLYAGALFLKVGTKYNLSRSVYAYYRNSNPGATQINTYGSVITAIMWNQYRRLFRTIRASLYGLNGVEHLPGLINEYIHADNSPHSNNKRWMLISYEQDLRTCKWRGVFKEVTDVTILKEYPTQEFRYDEG